MKTNHKLYSASMMCKLVLLTLALAGTALAKGRQGNNQDLNHDGHEPAKTLYVWAGDQARVAADFLAVINFDEDSEDYGKVIGAVPVPPPDNVGNEAHHCHPSADHNILACGGLLRMLRGQNGIFFFDVSDARHPKFLVLRRIRTGHWGLRSIDTRHYTTHIETEEALWLPAE